MTVRRSLACIAAAGLLGLTAGCGDDENATSTTPASAGALLSLSEVGSLLERGALDLVRTGGGGKDQRQLRLRDSARYEDNSGREFDVLVFPTEADAVLKLPETFDESAGESAVRAANVVAVFPTSSRRFETYRVVADTMRRLRLACAPGGESGEPELRNLCFAQEGGIPPQGGIDRSQAREREQPIVVDGLHYDPLTARQLNPNTVPDEDLLSGRRPPEGDVWFGVFLRVCNRGDKRRTASERVALVDAFGKRVKPSTALSSSNPFVYEPGAIEPGDCLPAEGSAAERTTDGALVLFAVAGKFLRNRPVALEVTSAGGNRRRVILDI